MKKTFLLISMGVLNLLHGLTHLIQFIQSIFLINYSIHEESQFNEILHNPLIALIWAVIGLVSLIIGIKDYLHHKNCNHK